MAWHTCRNGNHDFWVGTPGRPPKNCPEHGGPKRKANAEPEPVINPEPVATLPNDIVSPGVVAGVITHDNGTINRYGNHCIVCGDWVDKNTGSILKVDDVWKIRHQHCQIVSGQTVHGGSEPDPQTMQTVAMHPADIVALANPVDPMVVRREVDKAITAFVNDTLPPMLKQAMQAAEVVRHEIVVNDQVLEVEGTTNKYFPTLIRMLSAGRPMKRLNVALPGPAGSGKSYMAVQAAKAMGLNIGIISFGPLTNTSKLFGYMDANGRYVRTPFREIWEHGGIMLGDEMDNAHPGLLAELNQALAGDIAAFADGMVPRHPEFRFVATMNTFGNGPDRRYGARNALDKATKNRFVWLEVNYDEKLETQMAMAFATTSELETVISRWVRYVQAVRAKADDAKLDYVFGPRNTEQGAMLLEAGMEWNDVVEACLFADVSAEHRGRLAVNV